MNYHRDGFMRVDANGDGSVNYEPNSLMVQCSVGPSMKPALRISAGATRYDHRDGNVAQALGIDLAEFTRSEAVAEK
jgi:hypothetical protein